MAFGTVGSLYLTDGGFLRKVAMDGTVTTIAKDLTVPTSQDKQTLFGGAYGSLAGLTVDAGGNVFVADAGNRRLLRITSGGKVDVVLRSEPPYFPNGAVATTSGDVYVLEVGFTLPNISSGPRIRKLSPDGSSVVVATVGEQGGKGLIGKVAEKVGGPAETAMQFFHSVSGAKYFIALASLALVTVSISIWKHKRK